MQKINGNILAEKAISLLESGSVTRVLGCRAGQFGYDVEPTVFHSVAEVENGSVWNPFCGINFSKYLLSETLKESGKVLVFLKPCDSYGFNMLLAEHRVDRERVYAVGIPCDGMVDVYKLKELCGDGIASVAFSDGRLTVDSIYSDEKMTVDTSLVLEERCVHCKSKKHVACDEIIGEEGEADPSHRFDEVRRIEAMSPSGRYAFWQSELSRCIRCNACRNACPVCTCEKCVFDNPKSGVENKAAANSFEEKLFHIIRAYHVAGRCTDCGECSRVCPQRIPLHLLNRKLIKDINELYGEYQAGAELGARAPLTDYTVDDAEPHTALNRRNTDA